MKKSKLFLGALAALTMGTMVSCTNEDVANGGSDNGWHDGNRYMAISISNPAELYGRAPESTEGTEETGDKFASDELSKAEFDNPVGNEDAIDKDNVRFYFFADDYRPFTLVQTKINGEVIKTNMVKPAELSIQNINGETTTKEGVLVLGKPDDPYIGKTPKYVCVAINLSEDEFNKLANVRMENMSILTTTKNTTTTDHYDWSKFKMTTSVYAKKFDNKDNQGVIWHKIMATEITEANLAKSEADAKTNPVHVYVERLAAKVRVTGLKTYTSLDKDGTTEKEYNIIGLNAEKNDYVVTKQKLHVNLTGWQIYNFYTQAKYFKDIKPDENYFPNWNDPDRHRCYWAITPSITTALLAHSYYNIYDSNHFTNKNFDASKPTENIEYIYPNTGENPTSASDRTTKASAIVVRGVVTTDEAGNEPINFVRWAGGYYTYEAFQKTVFDSYLQLHPNASSVSYKDVYLKSMGNNKYEAWVKVNNTNDIDMSARYSDIEWWNDGVTSFLVNIQHAVGNNGKPIYGIVRNHIYDHNATAVIGLGVPGNDPVNPSKEEESYLACTVNVLNWRVISKNIVLE